MEDFQHQQGHHWTINTQFVHTAANNHTYGGGHPDIRCRRQTYNILVTNENVTCTDKPDARHHLSSNTAGVESDGI